jgi:hypothetical protein
LNLCCSYNTGFFGNYLNDFWFGTGFPDDEIFNIKDYLSDIFLNTIQRRKFVVCTGNFDVGYRCTFQRGKQNSPEAVSYCRAKSMLKRLDTEKS